MKEIKLNNSERMNTTGGKKQPEGSSSNAKNLKFVAEQTQGNLNNDIENAEIIPPTEKMDEIIRNNDKFETIRVLMEILCKELGISIESGIQVIAAKLKEVSENYYKSMEEWRELNKNGKK